MAPKNSSLELFRAAIASLNRGEVHPIYVIEGSEHFFIDRFLQRILQIIPSHERDFNSDFLYGNEVQLEAVLQLVKSYPMMAERRLVVVKNANDLFKRMPANLQDDFLHYLKHPNPQTIFVIHLETKIPKNTRLGKGLHGAGIHTLLFDPLADHQLASWVMGWAKQEYSTNLSEQVAQLLAQLVGNDLKLLSSEIDKICTYTANSEGEIDLNKVRSIVGSYRGFDVFELKEAINQKKIQEAFFIAERILQQSKSDTGELIRIVAFLYSDFLKLWQIIRLKQASKSDNEIKKALHINSPYYYKRLSADANRYTAEDMMGIFNALLDADRAIKGFSTMDVNGILMLLIKRLIHPHNYA